MKWLLCFLPLLLSGCSQDEFKCIDHLIYVKRGEVWRLEYPKWECHPVEENK